MADASDQELVVRAQGGDVDAIGELYDRHHEGIFRFVWSRVENRHLAEDLTGDVFAHMLRGLPNYRPRGVPFRAWLYRIARNLLVDHYRKEEGRVSVALERAEDKTALGRDPSTAVEHKLTMEQVQRALAGLADAQREVVALRFLSGLSLKEVALAMGKSVGAIKSLQHRGLAVLRLALAQDQE